MSEEMIDTQGPRGAGRPRRESAQAHAAIMDAVLALLQDKSVRDLTMEAVAKRAKVGKPTLYKWWPSKAALVFTAFHERLSYESPYPTGSTPREAIRGRARRLIAEFDGLFGRVVVELIAEGQTDPLVLAEFHERHVRHRRAESIAWIRQAQADGALESDLDAELVVDQIFGPIYYRKLLGIQPLDQAYADRLVDQAFGETKSGRIPQKQS